MKTIVFVQHGSIEECEVDRLEALGCMVIKVARLHEMPTVGYVTLPQGSLVVSATPAVVG